MSGLEVLGAAASVASLLDFAENIVFFVRNTKNAERELEDIELRMKAPITVLRRLQDRIIEAQKQSSQKWYEGIRSLDPNVNPLSPIARLLKLLTEVQILIQPAEPWKKKTQKLTWHWQRDKVEGKFSDIESCCIIIDSLLQHDQFSLSRDTQEGVERNEAKIDALRDLGKTQQLDNEKQLALALDLQRSTLKNEKTSDDVAERVKNLELRSQEQHQISQEQLGILKKQEKEKTRKKKSLIAEWLSPFHFLSRQQELSQKYYTMGRSIYDSPEFLYWSRGASWSLYVRGDAGSGKTYLSAVLADKVRKQIDHQDVRVIHLYLDHKDQKLHTKTALLGSLLKQLIQLRTDDVVSETLVKAYDRATERPPLLSDVQSCLNDEITSFSRVFVIVDGLDECSEKTRLWLMETIPELGTGNVSVLFTTRDFEGPEDWHIKCSKCKKDPILVFWSCEECEAATEEEKFDICHECFEKGVTCNVKGHDLVQPFEQVFCDIHFQSDELASFIDQELQIEMGNKRRWDVRDRKAITTTAFGRQLKKNLSLLEEIKKRVVDLADGHMVFATLCLRSLRDQRSTREIKQVLKNLSSSLDSLYDSFLQRIQNEDSNKQEREAAITTFAILSASQRNLTVQELLTLLAVSPDDKDYDADNEYDKEGLLDWTKNLITMYDEVENGERREEVRLFHSTFDSYIQDNMHKFVNDAHALVARKCLTYLSFPGLTEPLMHISAYENIKKKYPLVAYASQFWGDHIRLSLNDDDLTELAIEYMSDPQRVAASMQLAWCAQDSSEYVHWDLDFPQGITDLHLCAWTGLTKCLSVLLDGNEDVDVDIEEANFGQSPLMLAARRRNTAIVSKLLELGSDVNKMDKRGRTALTEAVEHKRERVVDMLIKDHRLRINDAYTIERTEHRSRTGLMMAASKGLADIIRVFVGHQDIDVNLKDVKGMTALMLAAESGSVDSVRTLIDDSRTDLLATAKLRPWTALTFAAKSGHAEIVAILLGAKDSQLKNKSEEISNAFSYAFFYEQDHVIDQMINCGADIHIEDKIQRSLLHISSYMGNLYQVEILLNLGLSVDLQDSNKLSPLHEACCRGHADVAESLITAGAPLMAKDAFDRTPGRTAFYYGHMNVLAVITDRNPESANEALLHFTDEALPAWALASSLKVEQLEEGLSSGRLDAKILEPLKKQTALHRATDQSDGTDLAKQISMLKTLLSHASHAVNATDFVKRTPLHYAAFWDNAAAIRLLYDHEADIDPFDQWEITPLSLAWSRSNVSAVSTLLEFGADPYAADIGVQQLFVMIVEKGTAPAVKCLLLQYSADPLEKDDRGSTAYDLAKRRGDVGIVAALQASRTLLRRGTLRFE